MKLAVLSESEVDETALRIIAEGLVGREVRWHDGLRRRAGGFGSVPKLLPALLRDLHYRTDVDGLLLVVDSDFTPVHLPARHSDYSDPECRFCALRRIADEVCSHLAPRPSGKAIRLAIGLAVPQIEAWYLFGLKGHASEAAWLAEARRSGLHHKYKNSLKLAAYGMERPPISTMKAKAIEHARRLVSDLAAFESFFKNGFGPFASAIRALSESEL